MTRCLPALARPLLSKVLHEERLKNQAEASLATFLQVCRVTVCPVCVIPSGPDGKSWRPAIANFIAMDSKVGASIAS